MIGLLGVALETIDSSGYILVRGERWYVEMKGKGPPIKKGQRVKVHGMKGLTLFVQPVETDIDP